jgi:hypothetical protein
MDRLLHISLFRRAADNVPIPHEVSWERLAQELSQYTIVDGEKESCPALSPAEWPKGATRSKQTVRRVWFGIFDFDKLTQNETDHVLDLAQGLATIFYTTWSHPERHRKNGSWSFRLVVPFSRPVEASEWPRLWPLLHNRFGSLPDDQCKDSSRIYFLPCSKHTLDPDHLALTTPGSALDVDQLLDTTPTPAPEPPQRTQVDQHDIEEYAKRLKRRISPACKTSALALLDGLNGLQMAQGGNRDNTIFLCACYLAEEWPNADPAAMVLPFARSFELMAQMSPRDHPTLEQFAEKISRKQAQIQTEKTKEAEQAKEALTRAILRAFAGTRDTPYTEDELNGFAQAASTTRQDFQHRWIIQVGAHYYFYLNGTYIGPYPTDSARRAAQDLLAPAHTAKVDCYRMTQTGLVRSKNTTELTQDYGQVALDTVADMSAQVTYFDAPTRTLIEATCPLRELEPRHDPLIEKWLTLLGGESADLLFDWLASITRLTEPLAAIYLNGVPGAGKTLLATGLSRLWTRDGPTSLADIIGGGFNESLASCPLVLADEVLPESFHRSNSTGELRELIQARSHSLRRKHVKTSRLRGCLRLMICANNTHLLETREDLNATDIEAITERFLYLHAEEKPKRFLRDLKPEQIRAFVEKDRIARFALYLAETRKVVQTGRFLVTGRDSALQRTLTTTRGRASAICHWCVDYLLDPGKIDTMGTLGVRIQNGRLLVTAHTLATYWEMYATNIKPPTAGRISRSLAGLCDSKVLRPGTNGRKTHYWPVKTVNLKTWAEELGYCTAEQIDAALAKDTQ